MIEDREKLMRVAQDVSDALHREGFQLALAEIEEDIIESWKAGKDVTTREESAAEYRAFERLKLKLKAFVDRGVQANSDNEREARRKSER